MRLSLSIAYSRCSDAIETDMVMVLRRKPVKTNSVVGGVPLSLVLRPSLLIMSLTLCHDQRAASLPSDLGLDRRKSSSMRPTTLQPW